MRFQVSEKIMASCGSVLLFRRLPRIFLHSVALRFASEDCGRVLQSAHQVFASGYWGGLYLGA